MKKKNKILYYILVIALFFLVTTLNDYFDDFEGGDLEVHFIDVGQGDSILIKSNSEAMLIDGGKRSSRDTVLDYLKKEGISSLKYVVGTHPHEDHIGGLANVIENIEVEKVIMPRATTNTQVFENLLDTIEGKGLKITAAKAGDSYDLDGSSLSIIAPNNDNYSNLNNYSVGIKLVFGKTSFLFTGDAEAMAEREMVENFGSSLRADVLKLGHHGSNTSSIDEFVDLVNPSYGIISAGEKNIYNHPDDDILDRFGERGIDLYRTDLLGNIVVISDGENIEVKSFKR